MKQILFLGTHGQKNWGDELLLDVFMRRLEGAAQQFYVNSYDPELTTAYLNRQNVTVFNTKTDKLKLLRYLWHSNALVFGGGNILKELYTAYGGDRYATLGTIDLLTKAARFLGKPIYLCNIGIGPLDTAQGQQTTKNIVQRTRLTTLRDSQSYDLLQSLQVTTPYTLTSDAVFTTDRPYFGLSAIRPQRRLDGIDSLKVIGINLCRNIANNNNWQYFMKQLAEDILRVHSQNPAVRFVGIPMQFEVANNNDYAALKELDTLLHQAAPDITFEIAKPTSLSELAATIDTLDMLIAERLHALIMALVLGIPVIALEYDIKVTSVIKDLGLQAYSVDINKKFKPGSFFDLVLAICGDYRQASTAITAAYRQHNEQSSLSFMNLREVLA